MDNLPVQATQSKQAPIVPPAATPPQTNNLRKFLNISSWIVLFALLPLTVLIFLSQDSIPGDFFYPVKRGMEGVVLAAASVNPATRAAFKTDLTAARFKEAQSLVISRSNASGLITFIDDVQSAQIEASSLKSDTERQKAEEKLAVKIEEYQSGLSTLEAKTEQNIITYQLQEIPTSTPLSVTTAPNETLTPSPIPTKIPTSTPTSLPLSSSEPKSSPTPTFIPSSIPTVAQTVPTVPPQPENTQIAEQKKIAATLKETKTTLEKIKKDLEKNKNENIQKTEKSNEGTNPNKDNLNKNTH